METRLKERKLNKPVVNKGVNWFLICASVKQRVPNGNPNERCAVSCENDILPYSGKN